MNMKPIIHKHLFSFFFDDLSLCFVKKIKYLTTPLIHVSIRQIFGNSKFIRLKLWSSRIQDPAVSKMFPDVFEVPDDPAFLSTHSFVSAFISNTNLISIFKRKAKFSLEILVSIQQICSS